MDHGGGGMAGMNMTQPGPPPSSMAQPGSPPMPHRKMMMMHMSFYWGKNAEIIFSGWPGAGSGGMYALSLLVVFLLAVLVEWLSRSRLVRPSGATANLLRTVLHAVRMGLAYLVMLAVMSFNGGVFIAAVIGHAAGFLMFGSRDKPSDLPPVSC